ncbi:MAG: TetR/AcrR family transcriptional regulator [Cyanobacteria bacterium J06614_10]
MATKLTKAEQTRRTRRAILDRAYQLFADQGYAATGTEKIIQGLGITRGALYHQFKGGKQAVFEAVVEEAYGKIADYITDRVRLLEDKGVDSWEQLVQGLLAFLEIAQQDDLRRIVFLDAPAVLPAETLVQLDQYGFGRLREAIEEMVDEGQLDVVDAEGFSHLLNGALNELAAWVAQSPNSKRLKTSQALVKALLEQHRVS